MTKFKELLIADNHIRILEETNLPIIISNEDLINNWSILTDIDQRWRFLEILEVAHIDESAKITLLKYLITISPNDYYYSSLIISAERLLGYKYMVENFIKKYDRLLYDNAKICLLKLFRLIRPCGFSGKIIRNGVFEIDLCLRYKWNNNKFEIASINDEDLKKKFFLELESSYKLFLEFHLQKALEYNGEDELFFIHVESLPALVYHYPITLHDSFHLLKEKVSNYTNRWIFPDNWNYKE